MADIFENVLKLLLGGARTESLHVEVGEVLSITSGGSLISCLVDVNFEGVTFPNLLVHGGNCILGIFRGAVLNIGEATRVTIIEDVQLA